MSHQPADWYPSPHSNDLVQYWDGEMWTDRIRPATAAAAVSPPPRQLGNFDRRLSLSKHVKNALSPDEQIVAGFMGTTGIRRNMFVATDTRILVIQRRRARRSYSVTEIEFDQIAGVRSQNRSGATEVVLTVDDNDYRTYGYELDHVLDFVEFVKLRADGEEATPAKSASAAMPSTSGSPEPEESPNAADSGALVAQLERLAALHHTGALTDQEFAEAKSQLLG